ncbi:unnamed protein product [Closterium sp. NIES-53]
MTLAALGFGPSTTDPSLFLPTDTFLEHRTKHIALRYFLARELQQRGQLHLAYVANRANNTDIFTKALQSAGGGVFAGGAAGVVAASGPATPFPYPSHPPQRLSLHSGTAVTRGDVKGPRRGKGRQQEAMGTATRTAGVLAVVAGVPPPLPFPFPSPPPQRSATTPFSSSLSSPQRLLLHT